MCLVFFYDLSVQVFCSESKFVSFFLLICPFRFIIFLNSKTFVTFPIAISEFSDTFVKSMNQNEMLFKSRYILESLTLNELVLTFIYHMIMIRT